MCRWNLYVCSSIQAFEWSEFINFGRSSNALFRAGDYYGIIVIWQCVPIDQCWLMLVLGSLTKDAAFLGKYLSHLA